MIARGGLRAARAYVCVRERGMSSQEFAPLISLSFVVPKRVCAYGLLRERR